MNNTTRLATIDTVLGGVPQFKCVEGCADCCGVIMMSRLEWRRIIERTGKSEKEYHAEVTKRIEAGNLQCVFLDDANKCSIYDIRPAVCRIFGASEHHRLTCPHGARPERLMTVKETDALMDKVDSLGR